MFSDVWKGTVEQEIEKFLRGRLEESIRSVNNNQKWMTEELFVRESTK